MEEALTFDDVALVPQFNNVPSRTEPQLTTWLTKNTQIEMPLIPANMDTVIGLDLSQIVIKNGGIPFLHRFSPIDEQKKLVENLKGRVFVSYGLGKLDSIGTLLEKGPIGVVLDVAHGHSKMMLETISFIKTTFPTIEVIAGNICTAMAYQDLVNAGADAVKVGIGPGASCTTRIVTGCGVPQFYAIQQCAKLANKLRVPVIADGGIRNSRDVVLALAAGASTVMLGKLFALTTESNAEKKLIDGVLHAKYRGQASADFQNEFYGGLKEKTVAEGTSFWVPVSGSAQNLIDQLMGGLRSGMTYMGARSIKELQNKAEFVKVTSNYMTESYPRRD